MLYLMLILLVSSFCKADVAEYIMQERGFSRTEVRKQLAEIAYRQNWLENDWRRYYNVMPRLINERGLKVGCEVGVSVGGHSEAILKNSSVEKLFSVDPYKPNRAGFPDLDDVYHDCLYLWVKYRLNQYAPRSQVVRAFSLEAVSQFEDESLDFVFIDGDHEYDAVYKDIKAWYDKVRKGGLVVGDDYTTCPGVKKAVDEIFNDVVVYHDNQEPRVWWVVRI